ISIHPSAGKRFRLHSGGGAGHRRGRSLDMRVARPANGLDVRRIGRDFSVIYGDRRLELVIYFGLQRVPHKTSISFCATPNCYGKTRRDVPRTGGLVIASIFEELSHVSASLMALIAVRGAERYSGETTIGLGGARM